MHPADDPGWSGYASTILEVHGDSVAEVPLHRPIGMRERQIFAAAGLERINVRPANSVILDWMLPAPAQGAIVVACRENDGFCREALAPLNHPETALCTGIERAFLRTLLGGCTTPISAYAYVDGNQLVFEGNLCSLNGDRSITVTRQVPVNEAEGIGKAAAEEVLAKGGDVIIEEIRNAQA